MSQSFVNPIQDLVIPINTTSSNVISREQYSDCSAIMIQAPGTMPETTVIQVSFDGSTWATLNDGTADIAGPAAGKARQYIEVIGAMYFRLLANGNVVAERTHKVSKQWIG